jgi:hypothetical protein
MVCTSSAHGRCANHGADGVLRERARPAERPRSGAHGLHGLHGLHVECAQQTCIPWAPREPSESWRDRLHTRDPAHTVCMVLHVECAPSDGLRRPARARRVCRSPRSPRSPHEICVSKLCRTGAGDRFRAVRPAGGAGPRPCSGPGEAAGAGGPGPARPHPIRPGRTRSPGLASQFRVRRSGASTADGPGSARIRKDGPAGSGPGGLAARTGRTGSSGTGVLSLTATVPAPVRKKHGHRLRSGRLAV